MELTKNIAQALCSTIILGYLSSPDAKQTQIQYSTIDEFIIYQAVQKEFKKLNVLFDISMSNSQVAMPYLLAKSSRILNGEVTGIMSHDLCSYLNIMETVKCVNPILCEAYTVGMSTTSTLFVAGPSTLDLYKSPFITHVNDNVKIDYNAAVNATNTSLKSLRNYEQEFKPTAPTVQIICTDMGAPIPLNLYKTGQVFKRYHGMTQAIVNCQNTIDKSNFMLEIALGDNSTKVSSCFPCCAFMNANDTPPISTHLDRGDYWNIPADCSAIIKKKWANKIYAYYITGKEILNIAPAPSLNITALGNRHALFSAIDTISDANLPCIVIPELFLAALTFKGKFTDKIFSFLGIDLPT